MKNFRRYLTVLMALLLALSMLLSSCVNQLPETPEDTTPTDSTPDGTTPPTPTECSHTNTTLVGKKDATCGAEGYTGDQVCSACGEVITEGSAIEKLAHTWDGGVQTKNPTCIEQGVNTFTCLGCGETKSESVDRVDHDNQYHDALDGTHNITCTTCTKNENEAHKPIDAGTFVPASCLEDAYTLLTCEYCNASYKVYSTAAEDKATGHSWGEWVETAATCTTKGSKTHTCQNCPESETVDIPVDPNAHSYIRQNPNDKPTCVDAVTAHYECEHCHATKDEEIPATGKHSYELQEDQGDGWTRQICSVCGDEIAKYSAENDTRAQMKAEDLVNVDTALEVNTQNAAIQFPQEVVSQMSGTADADVAISADIVTPEDKATVIENATNLTQEQKDRLADVEIYDFGVTVNDQPLSDKDNHFAAPVTVTMPYELKPGEDPDGIVIWYVQDDGTIEEVAAVYDEDTQTVTFAVNHFSFYAVAYRETQEMRCKRGNHLDDVLVEVIPQSCSQFGYTVYQCSCCLRTTIGDIVDRSAHAYGDIIPAHPTCTEGDYSKRECSVCHDVLLVEYSRATGHTADGVATCTTPSTCTTCHEVITPAKGHSYTEWTIVIEPTDVNPGLRRRYCTTCGTIEEVRIAATGNITEISFDSYQEMMESIFVGILNLENGVIRFTCTMQGVTHDFTVTVKQEEESYLALFEGKLTANGEEAGEIYALYRNGVMIYSETDGDVQISNLDSVFRVPYETFVDYLEQSFDMVNPMAEAYLEQARMILAEYTELYGERINNALEAIGSEYTVEELSKVLDAVETVYTYAALKLGFDTNLSMHDGVKIPTKNDLVTVIGALMTSTESEGNTTYTWNADELMEAANAVVAWLKEYNEKALNEVIYDLIGEGLKESYPELTDWAACEAKLREMLPGTTTLQDLLDVVITALESNEICTLEELFSTVDMIIEAQTGEEFSSAEFVEVYGPVTLDELAAAILEDESATMDALYDMLSQMLAETKLGTMPIPMGEDMMTLADLTQGLEQTLGMIDVEAAFSFTVDAKGNLIGLDIDGAFGVFMPDESGNMPAESPPMMSVTMDITHDDNVTIEIPEIFEPVADQHVTAVYDENGNLIISGLDDAFEYAFSIRGSDRFNMGELLKKDEEKSAELGFDVFVTDPAFWNTYNTVQTLVKIDGKYYEMDYTWVDGHYVYGDGIKWADIKSGESDALYPTDEESISGYYRYYDEALGTEVTVPVYQTILGPVYQMNGEWSLLTSYGTYWEYEYDKENGKESRVLYYNVYDSVSYDLLFELLEISMINEGYDYDKGEDEEEIVINGAVRELICVTLDYDGDGVDFNREFIGYLDNDELYLVEMTWKEGRSGYKLSEEVTLNENYDRIHEYEETISFIDDNGNLTEMTVTIVNTSKKVPNYYAKLDEGVYTLIGNLKDEKEVGLLTGKDVMTLPSGKTLYVLGTTTELEYCRENGCEAAYGYLQVGPRSYAMVFCYFRADQILDVVYYSPITTTYVSYNDVVDLDEYMTENEDGTYTVKAELFTLLNGWCTEEGESYTIEIEGVLETETNTYYAIYYVGTCIIPEEISFGGGHASEDKTEMIDWYFWFYYQPGGDMGGYQTQLNEDGTLSITFSGSSIDVDYRIDGSYPADALLKVNQKLGEELGLNISYYQTDYHTGYSYVFKDGKYYSYNLFNDTVITYAESIEDLIANHWRIGDLYYRYTTIPSDEYPEPMRVYDGTVYFGHFSNDCSMRNFFTIMDGTLYVLKQAVEMGNSTLKYEAMVPASEYYASLLVEESPYSSGGRYYTVYVDGVQTQIYYYDVAVYETDDDGNKLVDENGWTNAITVYIYYTLNGDEKRIMIDEETNGSYLVLGSEATLESGYESINKSTLECTNGTFERVYVDYIKYEDHNFVNLAGTFYRLDDSYWSYMNQRIDEQAFLQNMADNVWCFGLKDADGNWTYYNEYTVETGENGDFFVPVDQIDPIDAIDYSYLLGYDAEGNEFYELGAFRLNMDEITVTEFDDGTVLYTKGGSGYLKGQDGYYVDANIVYDSDDMSVGADCWSLDRATIDGYQIGELGLLDEYITVEGTTLIISPELLDEMKDYSYGFEIIVDGNYGSHWFNYYDLDTMFLMNEDGNEDGNEEILPDVKPDDGTTEDGKTEEGKTEDGTTEDDKTDDGYVEVLPEDGKTEDGAYEDVTTEEGKTEEGKTEDGTTAA